MMKSNRSACSQICAWIRRSRAVRPDQIVLAPEEGGSCSQPALRTVVRNSPVKPLAGFAQCFLEGAVHDIPQQLLNEDPKEGFPSGLAA